MKQGANVVDKVDIAALAESKMSVKQIAKKLLIAEEIVTLWMPKAVADRAKAIKAEMAKQRAVK